MVKKSKSLDAISAFDFNNFASIEEYAIFVALSGLELDDFLMEVLVSMSLFNKTVHNVIASTLDPWNQKYFTDRVLLFLLNFKQNLNKIQQIAQSVLKTEDLPIAGIGQMCSNGIDHPSVLRIFTTIDRVDKTRILRFYLENRTEIVNSLANFSFVEWVKTQTLKKLKISPLYSKPYLVVKKDFFDMSKKKMYVS